MIDCHSHILPKIDDGSSSLEETLEMARQMVENGVSTVIATPHGFKQLTDAQAYLALRDRRILEVQKALAEKKIPLTILPGMECVACSATIQALKDKMPIGLNQSQFVLIEFPFSADSDFITSYIFQLQLLGVQPIIAHPERQQTLKSNKQLWQSLSDNQIVMQLTTGSLLGDFGFFTRWATLKICKQKMKILFASDAHDARNRVCSMARAKKIFSKKYGEEYTKTVFHADILQQIINKK